MVDQFATKFSFITIIGNWSDTLELHVALIVIRVWSHSLEPKWRIVCHLYFHGSSHSFDRSAALFNPSLKKQDDQITGFSTEFIFIFYFLYHSRKFETSKVLQMYFEGMVSLSISEFGFQGNQKQRETLNFHRFKLRLLSVMMHSNLLSLSV